MIQDNIDSASVSYSCHKNKQIISQPDIVEKEQKSANDNKKY